MIKIETEINVYVISNEQPFENWYGTLKSCDFTTNTCTVQNNNEEEIEVSINDVQETDTNESIKDFILKHLYIISYGLGGGFGEARNFEVIQTNSLEDAEKWAWKNACEEYESYEGMYGLRTVDEIMQKDEIEDEEEAIWLDYSAQPYSKEYEKKIMYNCYNNPYKELTDIIN